MFLSDHEGVCGTMSIYGATVMEQVYHGILSSSSDEEASSYDDKWWYDDEYWSGDVPSCGGTMDSIGGMMNSGGVIRILVV